MKKLGFSTKIMYGFAVFAALFVTLSGILYEFNYETTYAYIAIVVLVVVVTGYNLIAGKR